MTNRLVITLESEERKALDELARCEFRDSRSQVRRILINELIRRGFLRSTIKDSATRILLKKPEDVSTSC